MNKEDRITYEQFIIAFSKFPKLVYTLYDKAEDEIERLNNIINELENYTSENIEVLENRLNSPFCNFEKVTKELLIFQNYLDKIKELKDSD